MSEIPAPETPQEEPARPGTPEIGIEDFAKIDLRVARVVRAEPHPNAEKLLRLQIDLGGETRQIVAGIAQHYTPQDLEGRLIVVVANLKPAKLRGEWSQGMLLAAGGPDSVSILTPMREVPPGASIR
jgi:methionyl-tRNA synthetase